MVNLFAVASFGFVGTVVAGTGLYKYRQYQLRNTPWFQEACLKAAHHTGVQVLVGPPPLEMEEIVRLPASQLSPLADIKPEPLYVLKVPIKGKNGKGNLLLWMNYLTSVEEARKNVEAWNVGLIEVQIGSNQDNKFIVD